MYMTMYMYVHAYSTNTHAYIHIHIQTQNIGPGGYWPEVSDEEMAEFDAKLTRMREKDERLALEYVPPGPRPDE